MTFWRLASEQAGMRGCEVDGGARDAAAPALAKSEEASNRCSGVSRASAARPGTHMWTAPGLQELWQRADRIACDHMSGLLMRSPMTAGQDGFRDGSSKQSRGFWSAAGSHGVSHVSDRSITPSARLEQAPAQREMKIALTPSSLCLGYGGRLRAIARARAAG